MSLDLVNLDDLLQLGPNPNFGAWAMQSTQNGKNDIDLLVGCLMQAGVANDKKEALLYMNDLTQHYKERDLVGADFDNIRYSRQMKLLRTEYEQTEGKEFLLYRMLGVLTHKFTWMLSSGRLPYHLSEDFISAQLSWQQRSLFDILEPSDRLFPEPAPFGNSLASLKDGRFLADMEQVLASVQPILANSGTWKNRCRRMRSHVHQLETMLRPIIGSYMKELIRYRAMEVEQAEYLTGLTIIIWASIVLESARSEELLIFPELPVMHKNHRIGFRRLDGLVITDIGGRKPNKEQRELVRKYIDAVGRGQFKPESASDLLILFSKVFGAQVGAGILDYKSAVGDFSKETEYLISPDNCPLQGHESQISLYLLLMGLDRYLLLGGDGNDDPWATEQGITKGELMYLLPTSRPFSVKIDRTPAEQKVDFVRNIVMKIPKARDTGVLRRVSSLLANHTSYLLNGNSRQARQVVARHSYSATEQQWLFSKPEVTTARDKIFEHHQVFLDEYKIVEILHTGDKIKYLMHIDKLFDNLSKITSRNFKARDGGFVACLNPDHEDKSPSMHVNLRKGFFKCYSCVGFSGGFDRASVRRVSSQIVNYQTFAAIRRLYQQTMKVVVPERLHGLLCNAQEALQECYMSTAPGWKRSLSGRGARYMGHERDIDPLLAYEHGAGFGTNYVIEHLFNAGYRYEEMVNAGLIRHRIKVSDDWSLMPLLTAAGYTFEEVTVDAEDDKRVIGSKRKLPYFSLMGRVTFPLMLEGFITNFYGRATWPTKVKHYKLSVTDGAYCHGGFNMEVLEEDHDELILAESVIDALSLMSMGYKSVIALLSVTNYAVLESALRSDKPLALALNNDKPGQEATNRLLEWMQKEMKYKFPIRNFTEEFFTSHGSQVDPSIVDYNEWWKNQDSLLTY